MSINPSPYFLVCQHEILSCSLDQKSINTKYCPVVSLYVKRALEYGIKLEMPAECGKLLDLNDIYAAILKIVTLIPTDNCDHQEL